MARFSFPWEPVTLAWTFQDMGGDTQCGQVPACTQNDRTLVSGRRVLHGAHGWVEWKALELELKMPRSVP